MFLRLQGTTYYLPQQKTLQAEIEELLHSLTTTIDNFTYYSQGKLLRSFEKLAPLSTIHAVVPLKGGKGGYGAKLKTEGGKKIKPNDNMFSRDMSGQRLVHANMERQFREFVVAKHEEDKRVAQEREQFRVMENTLKEGQSFMKLDKTYKKDIQQTEKNLIESIKIGKQKAMQKLKKQKEEKNGQLVKKEEQKDDVQIGEENKQPQQSLKRSRPQETQENVGQNLTKKVKQQTTVKPTTQKPVFSSAQQRFKNLFKK